MNCPECNSDKLYKKGFRRGKQRYQCKECGRNFVEGTKFVGRQVNLPSLIKACVHCGSFDIIRDGRLESGGSRYKCKNCGKSFSSKTVVLPPVEYECPYCGGKLTRSGKGKLGQPEYFCTQCYKSCSGDPPKRAPLPFSETNTEVHCPYCNSLKIKLRGIYKGKIKNTRLYSCAECGRRFNEGTKEQLKAKKLKPSAHETCPYCNGNRIISAGINSKSGKQRFRCLDCKRSYTKGVKPKLSIAEKRKILMYKLNLGLSTKEISEHFGCSTYMIEKLVKDYKKNLAQKK